MPLFRRSSTTPPATAPANPLPSEIAGNHPQNEHSTSAASAPPYTSHDPSTSDDGQINKKAPSSVELAKPNKQEPIHDSNKPNDKSHSQPIVMPHRTSMLSTCTIGIIDDENDQDDYTKHNEALENIRRIQIKNLKDPKAINDAFQEVTMVVEAMTVTARDNNVILYQMLVSMEERINRRIEKVKEELIQTIDAKIAAIPPPPPPPPQTASVSSSGSVRGSSHRNSLYKPGSGINGHPPLPSSSSLSQSKSHSNSHHSLTTLNEEDRHSGTSTNNKNPQQQPQQQHPAVIYEDKEIIPYAGFVIKTKKLMGLKEKVFINIFHHELIEYLPMTAYGSEGSHENPSNAVLENRPYFIMGTVSHVLDKEGQNCVTYNIGISSEYFKQPNPLIMDFSITSPNSVHKIIHKINLKFNEFLDESSYSLPRLANGYKGDAIPPLLIPVPVSPSTSTSATARHVTAKKEQQPLHVVNVTESSELHDSSAIAVLSKGAIEQHNHAIDNTNTGAVSGTGTGSGTRTITGTPSVISASGRRSSLAGGEHGETSSIADSTRSHQNKRKAIPRKSLFDSSQHVMNSGHIIGRNMLSGNMLEYRREDCIDGKLVIQLKEMSIENPYVLLGWQIQYTNDHGNPDLYVITDLRKNLLSKTEFRLSNFTMDDHWVKLKRGEGKSGNEFRPMRKVLFGLSGAEDDDFGDDWSSVA